MSLALQKRQIDPERIERVVNGIMRRLESSGESEIPTKLIGELVMDALATLAQVAYVRFATVYGNFREARDFDEFIGQLGAGDDCPPGSRGRHPVNARGPYTRSEERRVGKACV